MYVRVYFTNVGYFLYQNKISFYPFTLGSVWKGRASGTELQGVFCFKSLISKEISCLKLCWWKVIAIIYSQRSLTLGTNLRSASEFSIY